MPAKAKKKIAEKSIEKVPEKSKEKTADKARKKEITFVCKFCEQARPLSDMVVLRNYYPQVTSCKDCAKDKKSSE